MKEGPPMPGPPREQDGLEWLLLSLELVVDASR